MQVQQDNYFEDRDFDAPLNYDHGRSARGGFVDASTIDSSVDLSQSTDGTPASVDQFSVNSRKDSIGGIPERKKDNKSKKAKKHKKDKNKKRKRKTSHATEKLLDGDMEGELDSDFDNFITNRERATAVAESPNEAKQARWISHQEANRAWAAANGFHVGFTSQHDDDDNIHQTPKSQNTKLTTMSSMEHMKPMLDALPSPVRSKSIVNDKSRASDGSSIASSQKFDGEMLQHFLQSNGQDEKLALATAMAFESFLQEQQGDGVEIGPSRDNSEGESIRTGTSSSLDDDDDDDSEEEDDEGIEIEAYDQDYSDVSTIGWSCGEESSFGNSWSDGTFVSATKSAAKKISTSANGEDDFSLVRQNEKFVRRNSVEISGGNRRVPNRVAAAQGRAVHTSVAKPASNRFGSVLPDQERSFEQQMTSLTIEERRVVTSLKSRWSKSGRPPFPSMWYLKFARCSPGRPFSFKTAYKSMRKYDMQFMNLTIIIMKQQLRQKMLFPVPGLKSMEGHNMFYMRPSRYFPKKMSTSSVINNLIYVMDCMLEKEESQRDGIGFVANMTDWAMSNFQVNYCYKFMMGLQAKKTPTRVQLFLIVNPPGWFGSIWSIMKPMLSEEFRNKVHMINYDALKKFLKPGFEEMLPDDILYGKQDTEMMVENFVIERRHMESERMLSSSSTH